MPTLARPAAARALAATAFALLLSLAFAGDAHAWGPEGHSYAMALAIEELPSGPLKSLYLRNAPWLESNASLADRWRLRGDRMEPARHHFYIGHYVAGTANKEAANIPSDPHIALHGRSDDTILADGTLPWIVVRHSRLLSAAEREGRWEDAMVETAWISGYAADACEPFRADDSGGDPDTDHTLAHRFEVGLVRRSIHYRDLGSGKPGVVHDPARASLDALSAAAQAVPNIAAADRLAGGDDAADGPNSDVYWEGFARAARPAAVDCVNAAGRLLSGLLIAAWEEAGRPVPPAGLTMTGALLPYTPPLGAAHGTLTAVDPPPLPDSARDEARERVRTITVSSRVLNRDVNLTAILPLGYTADSRRYPVLYLLHGSSGSETDWPRRSGIAATAEKLPLIVIMPGAGDSWYVDSPGQGKYESFFVQELVPAIDRTFRTIAQRNGRALAGNSMGGYGAWRLALDHNDLFCCAAALSGALDMGATDPMEGEPREWIIGLYGGTDRKALRAYHSDDLYHRIDSLTKRKRWTGPALHFSAGWDDYLLESDRHMARYLLERDLPCEYAEFPGSHDWQFWDSHIGDVLNFTLRHVTAPAGP